MPEITIDADICTRDGLCARACMRGILRQDEKGTVPALDEFHLPHCYGCGQCVAICPSGALSHSGFPEGSVRPVDAERLPGYDHLMELIRSRRSKRLFKDEPVERTDIEKLLEAARFAPSGHNEQTTEFIVVRDKAVIDRIGDATAAALEKMGKQYQNPIAKTVMRATLGQRKSSYLFELAPELTGLASLYEEGTDWIIRGAPTLMLFCADSAGDFFARVNANLALHNVAMAAETVGVGCFYAGFVVLAADRGNEVGRLVGLPETHEIYGALAMGYPRLKFNKWPERNPAQVAWVEG